MNLDFLYFFPQNISLIFKFLSFIFFTRRRWLAILTRAQECSTKRLQRKREGMRHLNFKPIQFKHFKSNHIYHIWPSTTYINSQYPCLICLMNIQFRKHPAHIKNNIDKNQRWYDRRLISRTDLTVWLFKIHSRNKQNQTNYKNRNQTITRDEKAKGKTVVHQRARATLKDEKNPPKRRHFCYCYFKMRKISLQNWPI